MNAPASHEVVIVGAGPVGLFLGCCLQRLGIRFTILERESNPSPHTRSIGVHPPSLERFARLGLADALLERGVRVQIGRVYSRGRSLGALSFAGCPGPFPFVLTAPQHETEAVLEDHLRNTNPSAVQRGVTVLSLDQDQLAVRVKARHANGNMVEMTGAVVVGCDGTNSLVREQMGARFEGGSYADSFVMGDFHDETGFGAEARIYLDDEGFVESFPLPGQTRRWVLRTAARAEEPKETALRAAVERRTGMTLSGALTGEITSFGAQRFLARPFHSGRVVLAGDAAHVTSPIGGQGMNVGWLNAWDLAERLRALLRGDIPPEISLREYDRIARRRARRAIRRAEFNMWIGRGAFSPRMRDGLVWLLLHSPAKWLLARVFTMRGL